MSTRLVIVLVVVAQLLASAFAGASYLCIEPDGRVAIERPGDVCCSAPEEAPAPSPCEGVRGECCDCIDIPLEGDAIRSESPALLAIAPEPSPRLIPNLTPARLVATSTSSGETFPTTTRPLRC